MNRILLVYEDYSDLMTVESALKKVGFDVIGLTSEYAIAEKILEFNPELVVGSGRGGKVSSLGVGKRLKEMARWQGKVVLLFPANIKPSPQDLIKLRVDMLLESPVSPNRLIQVFAKLLGHDEAALLERLGKAAPTDVPPAKGPSAVGKGGAAAEDDAIYVRGSGDAQGDSQDTALSSEKIEETDETQGLGFKFGDRMSAADDERRESSKVETEFPDVDLKALENELLGGGAPVVERIEPEEAEEGLDQPKASVPQESAKEEDVFTVRGNIESGEAVTADATMELRQAEFGLAEKMAKYKALTADVKLTPKSNMTRVEARKRQRDLQKAWKPENIKDQDSLRRDFTTALFKK